MLTWRMKLMGMNVPLCVEVDLLHSRVVTLRQSLHMFVKRMILIENGESNSKATKR